MPPTRSGNTPGSPPSWTCLENLHRKVPRRHPSEMAEQLAPLDAQEQTVIIIGGQAAKLRNHLLFFFLFLLLRHFLLALEFMAALRTVWLKSCDIWHTL